MKMVFLKPGVMLMIWSELYIAIYTRLGRSYLFGIANLLDHQPLAVDDSKNLEVPPDSIPTAFPPRMMSRSFPIRSSARKDKLKKNIVKIMFFNLYIQSTDIYPNGLSFRAPDRIGKLRDMIRGGNALGIESGGTSRFLESSTANGW